jgi:DNA-binding NarL/FixJ family response regulator
MLKKYGSLDTSRFFIQPPLAVQSLTPTFPDDTIFLISKRSHLKMQALSYREMQIISYMANGCTAKQIAQQIGLKYRTIEMYISKIRKKLQAKNIAHAIYIASQKNLVL